MTTLLIVRFLSNIRGQRVHAGILYGSIRSEARKLSQFQFGTIQNTGKTSTKNVEKSESVLKDFSRLEYVIILSVVLVFFNFVSLVRLSYFPFWLPLLSSIVSQNLLSSLPPVLLSVSDRSQLT